MDNNEVVVAEEVAAVAENNTGIEIEPLFEEQVDFDTFSKSDFRVVKVKNCEAVPKSKKLLRFTLDDGTENERTILSGVHAFYEPEELVGKTLLAIVNLPPRSMMGIDSCGMLLSAIHNVNGEEKLNLVMLDDSIPAGAKLYRFLPLRVLKYEDKDSNLDTGILKSKLLERKIVQKCKFTLLLDI